MEEFCSGMPPSYSQLKPESTALHIAAAGWLKNGDEAASKPEFWLPFLPVRNPAYADPSIMCFTMIRLFDSVGNSAVVFLLPSLSAIL
jgi:hypothetical protein